MIASSAIVLPLGFALLLSALLTACWPRFDAQFSEDAPVSARFNTSIFAAVLAASCLGALDDGPLGERLSLVALGGTLCCAAIVDLRHLVLPDLLLAPLGALGLARAATDAGPGLEDGAIGLAVGAGSLLALRALYRYLRGVEGIGLGDVKLVGVAGAWIGWQRLPDLLLLASLSTLTVALVIGMATRSGRQMRPWPFGPGLALGLYGIAFGLPPLAEASWS